MKIKTSELTGAALDWAVAKCEGALHPLGNVMIIESKWLLITVGGDPDHGDSRVYFRPREDWAQGGPIIEREGIELKRGYGTPLRWAAFAYDIYNNVRSSTGRTGSTPLVAAMRCYVASKIGDEVDIPEELAS